MRALGLPLWIIGWAWIIQRSGAEFTGKEMQGLLMFGLIVAVVICSMKEEKGKD